MFIRLLAFIAFFVLMLPSAGYSSDEAVPADVRLVIDVSGSMKKNDPGNLRQPAVELLVQLLPDDSKAGVWTFGKWVNMLVPHKPVSQSWRESAQALSAKINSVGLYTNIGEALEKAAYDIESENKDFRKSIILLTDGMVDVDKESDVNQREWRRIVDEVLPKLKSAGFTVHTIALSDNADKELMNRLSLGTDGLAEVAHTADDLMRIFLKAFDASAPSEQVPLDGDRFVIDSSVEEFTALIFRKPDAGATKVIGPDEQQSSASSHASDVSWYSADNYDLITVKQPLEGEWILQADMEENSRVTVISNLNLRVKPLTNNAFLEQQVNLDYWLQEDGNTINRAEFLSLMEFDVHMSAGNSAESVKNFWSKKIPSTPVPADGIYSSELPSFEKAGVYKVNLVVDGKSFRREFSHQFTVREPFGADVKELFTDGNLQFVLTVRSFSDQIDFDNTQVIATIIDPNNSKRIRPLTLTEMDTWQTQLDPQLEGEYIAQVAIKGRTLEGPPIDINLEDIDFNYSAEAGFVEQEEPFFEPSPTPVPVPDSTAEPEATPEPVQATDVEPEEVQEAGAPAWLMYTILGVGNLLLFGIGFVLYKKIMGGGKPDDVLEQFSDENIEKEINVEEQSTEEVVEEELPPEEDAFEEVEPPMEDLDPVVEQEESTASGAEEMEVLELSTEDIVEEIDDLDAMAEAEQQTEEAPQTEEEEEEDMVSAMLKAQGLDLAEDELDDAISTLIDDLDRDEDEDK